MAGAFAPGGHGDRRGDHRFRPACAPVARLRRARVHRRATGRIQGRAASGRGRAPGIPVRNREYRESPVLQFEYDRRSREVTARQQLYTELYGASEQARIEEVRNIPRVTVIEPAEVPARPKSRRLLLRRLLAGIAGAFLGLGAALWAQGMDRSRAGRAAGGPRTARTVAGVFADLHRWPGRFGIRARAAPRACRPREETLRAPHRPP